jgi:pimeloyl-ACP methyl ester carboxylesterase
MPNNSNLGLLLLHALPFNQEMWSDQMTLLPQQTYAPDLYKYGGSIQNWAAKSLALVQTKKLIVVGCSVGGSCALEVAFMAHERVAALVLIGTKARHDPNPNFYAKSVNLLKNLGVESAWKEYWEPLFSDVEDKKVEATAKGIALRQSPEHLINGLSAFHTRPSREKFVADCNIPTHVITGEYDELPGLDYCRDLASSTKSSTLHVIEESGHYVPMTQPDAFNEILSEIIATHSKT